MKKWVVPPEENRLLTARESQIAGELWRDEETEDLAKRFGLTRNTIKSYLKSIYRKLGVNYRHAAVVKWIRIHGLPPEGD